MSALLAWRNYRYFPYEKRFAAQEVQALLGAHVSEENAEGLFLPNTVVSEDIARRLTYFARVVDADGRVTIPNQAHLEASASTTVRERQATRYSAHGLHEYKGKFNPQVVRAIGNRLGLSKGAWVLDPFTGSGTTLLECAHAGWNAVGVDRNPLAVKIANAKIRALELADGRLSRLTREVVTELTPWIARLEGTDLSSNEIRKHLGESWLSWLPGSDYLASWFPQPVLAQAAVLFRVLSHFVPDDRDRSIFEVVLSDQLRDCSFQEPADLRIRRRKLVESNYQLLTRFCSSIADIVSRVERARLVLGPVNGSRRAVLADIRGADLPAAGVANDAFDAIICSPPYATALPYIDTQRLSLVLFGLVDPSEIRGTENALVGARDIGLKERGALEREISAPGTTLAKSVLLLCRELLAASLLPGNGFRRRNTPALVYRYFKDMARFFVAASKCLRPGATAALVVGSNRTTLGGREFRIDTPRLLADVAVECGFTDALCEPMETYQRYDMHQKNSINDEMLVLLRRPADSAPTGTSQSVLRELNTGQSAELIIRDKAVPLPLVPNEGHGHLVKHVEVRVPTRDNSQLILGFR